MLDPDFCYGYLFVSLLPCIYHKLMVVRYCSKWEKFQMAKCQSIEEQRPVHELEWAMDVELFMEIQNRWPEDSPHCLVILHEMFWHAAIEGQKEAEQTICQGHQQHMPQLNPEVGIPTIQLVGPETTQEELLKVYLEVYKVHRLPGSPPREPAILEEIMASVPDHPCIEEDQTCEATVQPHPGGSHSSRSSAPHRRKNDEEKRRQCQVRFADEPAPSQSANPKTPLGEEGSKGGGSDLEELPELKLTVASFL